MTAFEYTRKVSGTRWAKTCMRVSEDYLGCFAQRVSTSLDRVQHCFEKEAVDHINTTNSVQHHIDGDKVRRTTYPSENYFQGYLKPKPSLNKSPGVLTFSRASIQ
ncbi:hypothetical protein RRG08_033184 [Elysia crispata]|uniref:Uncharacterized protein n=1 Tax=Elysia crispata TaxID=231223 RepID=A0AAE1BB27_9GAST|nr:hypothetical protein RRG08_033184 [Elysia crispata]